MKLFLFSAQFEKCWSVRIIWMWPVQWLGKIGYRSRGERKGGHLNCTKQIPNHLSSILNRGASLMAQMVKNQPAKAGDLDSIPGSGRLPGEGNGNPLQYSCLGNSRTEEPGRLQPTGSQKVRHDWAASLSFFLVTSYMIIKRWPWLPGLPWLYFHFVR